VVYQPCGFLVRGGSFGAGKTDRDQKGHNKDRTKGGGGKNEGEMISVLRRKGKVKWTLSLKSNQKRGYRSGLTQVDKRSIIGRRDGKDKNHYRDL